MFPVKVAMVNGEPWFVGKDIARVLDYENPEKYVGDIEEGTARIKAIAYCEGCVHHYRADLVNRIGVLLLFQRMGKISLTEKAEAFKKWLLKDMYPVLNEGGIFLSPLFNEGDDEDADDDCGEDWDEDDSWDDEDWDEDDDFYDDSDEDDIDDLDTLDEEYVSEFDTAEDQVED